MVSPTNNKSDSVTIFKGYLQNNGKAIFSLSY